MCSYFSSFYVQHLQAHQHVPRDRSHCSHRYWCPILLDYFALPLGRLLNLQCLSAANHTRPFRVLTPSSSKVLGNYATHPSWSKSQHRLLPAPFKRLKVSCSGNIHFIVMPPEHFAHFQPSNRNSLTAGDQLIFNSLPTITAQIIKWAEFSRAISATPHPQSGTPQRIVDLSSWLSSNIHPSDSVSLRPGHLNPSPTHQPLVPKRPAKILFSFDLYKLSST